MYLRNTAVAIALAEQYQVGRYSQIRWFTPIPSLRHQNLPQNKRKKWKPEKIFLGKTPKKCVDFYAPVILFAFP